MKATESSLQQWHPEWIKSISEAPSECGVENIEGWEQFALSHPFLIQMCEVIIYRDSEYKKYNDGWTQEDKRNALAHLKALESFIYVIITLQHSLLYLKEAAVRLQGENQDIVSG